MAPTLLLIKDVEPNSRNWTCNVIVAEKGLIKIGQNNKPYQRVVLQDIEKNKVQATIFSNDIEVLTNKLKPYHTYAITNANVKPIEEKHRFVTNDYQWTLSGSTPIKEIQVDGLNARNIDFDFVKLGDLEAITNSDAKLNVIFAIVDVGTPRATKGTTACDIRVIDQSLKPTTVTLFNQFSKIDAAAIAELNGPYPIVLATRLKYSAYYEGLSTRNSTLFHLNPSLQEAVELQSWCLANNSDIQALPNLKANPSSVIKATPPPKEKLLKIADLPPTVEEDQFLAIQAQINVTNLDQKLYYIACSKCNKASDAFDEDEVECNWCSVKAPAIPTLKIDAQLTDITGSITATVFGQQAEEIFQIAATEIKEYTIIDNIPLAIIEKLRTPKLFNFNIKVSKYKPGTIELCRYTIRSAFPVTVENQEPALKMPSASTANKVQKQLFLDDASSASQQNMKEEMKEKAEAEHKIKEAKSKKRN